MQRVFRHGGLRLFLLMLLDEQPRHGYDLIRLVEDRFLGMYTPSAGTVYPRLQSLEDDGLVEHEEVDGRKVYRLTDAGRGELAERRAELEELQARAVESARRMAGSIKDEWGDSFRDIRDEIRHAMNDVRRQERRAARGARDDWDVRRPRRSRTSSVEPAPERGHEGHEGHGGPGRRGAEGRRQGRGGAEGRAGAEGLAVRALRTDLDAFAVDVMAAARDRLLDRPTLAAVREALLDAHESVITALRSAGPGPSHRGADRPRSEAPGARRDGDDDRRLRLSPLASGRTRAPLIGIVAHPMQVDEPEGVAPHHAADARYVDSVRRAGGSPVLLPVSGPEDAVALIERVDGVLLTGGGDIDPARYGQARGPSTGEPSAARDAADLAACVAAVKLGRPTLAVCRGMQVLNVALGGTLVQHVAGHYDADRQDEAAHEVSVDPGSALDRWLGGRGGPRHLGVNTLHHQVLDQLGEDVLVVSRAPDGVPEAVELRGRPEILGVQWHPELLGHRAEHLALFRSLVARAGSEAQR